MVLRRVLSTVPLVTLFLVAVAVGAAPVAAANPRIVVVSHDGQHGWHSRVTDGSGTPNPTSGSVTFVTGPSAPPRGVGSVRLMTNPGMGDGSAQIRNSNYGGVRLASLTELNYFAYSATNNGQQFPFLALNVNNSGNATSTDDILFFEPPYQQVGTGGTTCAHQGLTFMVTWQNWDALSGCWWDNNGELGSGGISTQPLSNYTAAHPNATIVNSNGVGGLRLAVGFASPADMFDGNVDMVTIGVVGGRSTSYDFEPPTCKEGDGNGDFQGEQNGDFQGEDKGKCR